MRNGEGAFVLVRVWLLGEFKVERRRSDGVWEEIKKGEWDKDGYARRVLKWLLCAPRRRAQRGRIIEDLWPGTTAKTVEDNLSKAISVLRKRILRNEGLLKTFGPHAASGYELADQSRIWVDSDACEALIYQVEQIGCTSPGALPLLQKGIGYFERGGCLEGDGGQWCYAVRMHVEQAEKRCRLWLAEAYEAQGMLWHARKQWRELLEADPLDEDALCHLMAFLHRNGMTKDALGYYEQAQIRFKEHGLPLAGTTHQLAEHLQQHIPSRKLYFSSLETKLFSSQIVQPSLPSLAQDIIWGVSEKGGQDMDGLRRRMLQQMIELTGFSSLWPILVEPQTDLSSPVTVEEFLMQSVANIRACWYLMRGKLPLVEEILSPYISPLMTLALRPSKYQQMAAQLATQAKILQATLAAHRLDFVARERACHEAVTCGHLSGDSRLLSAAFMNLGCTCMSTFSRRPKEAVEVFLEALHILGGNSALLGSDIYICLADAYAQCKEEQKALEYIGLAQEHFPEHPELDASFWYADYTWSELYRWAGKTYLDLAQFNPEGGYYKKADAAFSSIAGLQPAGEHKKCGILISRADAARGLGDLDLYATSLKEGIIKTMSIGSQKRYQDAIDVFRHTPQKWKDEQQILELGDIFRQLSTRETEL
jgi:DNA-binding SARP family transcriptional activator